MSRLAPPARTFTSLVPFAALAIVAASAGSALGVARVGLGPTGNLAVAVDPGAGQDDDHGIIAEPFTDGSRNGFRVRQDALGRPPFATSDTADCSFNPIFNDVVCNGPRGSAEVTTFRGADVVTLRDDNPTTGACVPSPVDANGVPALPPGVRATLALGGGADTLVVTGPTICPLGSSYTGQIEWSVLADGEGGDDDLTGGVGDDDLRGGLGEDDLRGGPGDDDFRGGEQRDVMDGGTGDDDFRGGDGNDAFLGGEGDDEFLGGLDGLGSDVFLGGPGIDTVSYVFSTQGVVVTVALTQNDEDGRPGENDELTSGVENVTGTQQADTLVGDGVANQLDGLAGVDQITGAAGADTLLGGDGDDTIDARDGARDARIDCGPGTGDVADIDLVDRPLFAAVRGIGSIIVLSRGCEVRNVFAIDDGPPGRLVGAVLRVGPGGVARARFRCPRNARTACRGVLRLRRAKPGRVVASARYDVARGSTEAIELELAASLRGRTLQAETVERGVSKKGPRSSLSIVRIR